MAPAATAPSRRPIDNQPVPKPSKIRYFKGKAPEAAPSDEDESSDEDQEEVKREEIKTSIKRGNVAPVKALGDDEGLVAGGAGRIIRLDTASNAKKGSGGVKMNLGGVKVGEVKAKVPVKKEAEVESSSGEEETDDEGEEEAPPRPSIKPPGSEESSEYGTDSEEESEEEVKKPAFRPVFVKKDQRGMTQEKLAAQAEEAAKQAEEMEAQRKLDSKELAGETIRRELAEKEATDLQPDVDDTDGLDPSTEFDAWRARELARLLRDKQAQASRDEEKAEIERRRALPEEQRLAEDLAHAEETRNREKGEMGFLQKYYHKGAFHQDDDLLNRDYTGATEHDVDMSMLPKVMQVRNFGKASRTKYTHLTDQDTTSTGWGNSHRPLYNASQSGIGEIGTTQTGCWNCGGPHMRAECPNNNVNDGNILAGMPGYKGPPGGPAGGAGGTSANNSALGFRGDRPRDYGGGSSGYRGDRVEGRDRGDNGYRNDGRERRFDEERQRDQRPRDDGYDRNRGKDGGYDRRDGNRNRDRERVRDHGDDRHRRGDRDDRERDRYRDSGRDSGRDRERDRDKDKDDRKRDDRKRDDRDADRDRDRRR